MKRCGLIPVAVATAMFALIVVSATPVEAQVEEAPVFTVEITDYPSTIEPGGSYNVTVSVTRPSGMVLPAWGTAGDQKWEVRVYFYDGLNCYNDGEWTEIPEGSDNYLYDGWWNSRTQGGSWTASMDDTREFTIPVDVVDYPRPSVDLDPPGDTTPMNEIPVGGQVRLKARFRLRGMEYTEGDNTFTFYGTEYELGSLSIEWSDGEYWQIDTDAIKTGIAVSEAGGGFAIPTWLLIALGVVVLIIVAAVAAVKLKGRGSGEFAEAPPESPPEEFPEPPTSPETPPSPEPETPPSPEPETPPSPESTPP